MPFNENTGEDADHEAYELAFKTENLLRSFTERRMTESYGKKWWDNRVSPDLRQHVLIRQEEETVLRGLPAHGVESPVHFTELNELKYIILNNWQLFEKTLGPQENFETLVTRLIFLRNIVAHSRKLTTREIQQLRRIFEELVERTRILEQQESNPVERRGSD